MVVMRGGMVGKKMDVVTTALVDVIGTIMIGTGRMGSFSVSHSKCAAPEESCTEGCGGFFRFNRSRGR